MRFSSEGEPEVYCKRLSFLSCQIVRVQSRDGTFRIKTSPNETISTFLSKVRRRTLKGFWHPTGTFFLGSSYLHVVSTQNSTPASDDIFANYLANFNHFRFFRPSVTSEWEFMSALMASYWLFMWGFYLLNLIKIWLKTHKQTKKNLFIQWFGFMSKLIGLTVIWEFWPHLRLRKLVSVKTDVASATAQKEFLLNTSEINSVPCIRLPWSQRFSFAERREKEAARENLWLWAMRISLSCGNQHHVIN